MNIITIFKIKLISSNLGIFPATDGIGRVPRGTPCYSTENPEIFYHSVAGKGVGEKRGRVKCVFGKSFLELGPAEQNLFFN